MPNRDNERGTDLDDVRFCAIGPGRRRHSTGGILETYVDDDAIGRHCTDCGAQPLQFCRWPDGTERKIPCLSRLKPATATQ